MPALAGVAAALEEGLRDGIAPALAAVVLRDGAPVHQSAHGAAGARPLDGGELFDVASLTKVMATGSIAARLAARGALPLDAPATRWLPALGPGQAAVTLRHLLAHRAGLPAWRPLLREPAAGRAEAALAAARAIGAEPLLAPPGERTLYSDLGFVALGLCLERLAGAPLEALFAAEVAGPLGLARSRFAAGPGRPGEVLVPTVVRETGEARRGTAHDENARALGGVAGHAGLLAPAGEVAALGQAWLEALDGRSAWLDAATARLFAGPEPGSERGLAWDRPSGPAPALGSRLGGGPRGAIGHLGFTGCSLWIDLDRRLVCALLTSHCPRVGEGERIRDLRRRFHDAVAAAPGAGPW